MILKSKLRFIIVSFLFNLLAFSGYAQGSDSKSLDQLINENFQPITDALNTVIFFTIPITSEIKIPFVLIWLKEDCTSPSMSW